MLSSIDWLRCNVLRKELEFVKRDICTGDTCNDPTCVRSYMEETIKEIEREDARSSR